MKSKSTAGVLAIFLGWCGGHKFYLGQAGTGVVYLLFFWTIIPGILGIIEGLNLFGMSQAAFDAKYNGRPLLAVAAVPGIQQQSTNVVVNVAPPPGYGPPPGHHHAAAAAAAPGGDIAARINALHDLKVSGALTEAEFNTAKQKLLMTSGNG